MDEEHWFAVRMVLTTLMVSLLGWYALAGVKVTYEDEGEARRRQAGVIAEQLVLKLPAILESFQARRRELRRVEGGYAQEDLAALLASTETSLRGALEGEDIAPLRDYVEEVFRAARERLRLPQTAALSSSRSSPLVRQAAFQEGVSQSAADAVLDRIAALIKEMLSRSKSQELTVTLCVVSLPDQAKFTMSAPSQLDQRYVTSTDGEIVDAYRGIYSYTLDKGSQSIHCAAPHAGEHWICGPLNLRDDPPVLACDLSLFECHPRSPAPSDCSRRRH
jgi:hypothetical protein